VKRHFQTLLTGLESGRAIVDAALEVMANPLELIIRLLMIGDVIRNAGNAADCA
jgi:hypothetical protein